MKRFLIANRSNFARLVLFIGIALAFPTLMDMYRCVARRPEYLNKAIYSDDLSKIERYFKLGGSPDQKLEKIALTDVEMIGGRYRFMEYQSELPLIRCIVSRRVGMLNFLISKGADVNAKDTYGTTALHQAAFQDKQGRITQVLIEAKADVNARNIVGQTPLDIYEPCGNNVRTLIEAGCLVTERPLFTKAWGTDRLGSWSIKATDIIKRQGRIANLKLADKQTTLNQLLWKAVRGDDTKAILELLDLGADPNYREQGELTHLAIQYLKNRIIWNWRYTMYNSSLYDWRKDTGEVVKSFVDHGANLRYAIDDKRYTALHYACVIHSELAVKVLLEAGLDPNARLEGGKTPIQALNAVEDYLR